MARPRRRLLLLVLAALLATSPATGSSSCGHAAKDELLDRLDTQLANCFDAQQHHDALEVVKDRVAASEFDRQRPLALAVFSNSSRSLDALAGAFASALFADTRAGGVQVLDLAQLLPTDEPRPSSNRDVKSAMRAALAKTLEACSERSLVVVENVQLLDDVTLPVLDTFLDPLNGERAHLQVHRADGSSKLLDASGAVFLFLFKTERADFEAALVSGSGDGSAVRAPTWRDFLMTAWTRKEGLATEFTPQAFVGRLTDGVALFARDEEAGADAPLRQECRGHKPEVPSAASQSRSWKLGNSVAHLTVAHLPDAFVPVALLVVFALLNVAKRWTQAVALKSARRGPIRHRKGRKKPKRP